MKFLILKRRKIKNINLKKILQNTRLEGTLAKVTPPLGSLQLDQPLLDCGLPLILFVQTNHTCYHIGGFSFLYIPIASAFVLMPCFYQCRLVGTPLDIPIANEIYVSIVKLQNC